MEKLPAFLKKLPALAKKLPGLIKGLQPQLPEQRRWLLFPLLCLLTGLQLALAVSQLDTQDVAAAFAGLGGGAIWLTALFLGLLAALLGFLTHSLFAGGALVVVPVMLLSFVNYFKTAITSTPLRFTDLALAGQVGDIASLNAGALVLTPVCVLSILWMILWLAVLLFFSAPLRLPWRSSALAALAPAALLTVVFWFALDAAVLTPLGAPLDAKLMSQSEANGRCGFPLGFWRSAKLATIQTNTVVDNDTLDDLISQDLDLLLTVTPKPKPSPKPSDVPAIAPTTLPTAEPTAGPTAEPTVEPTVEPTAEPSAQPSAEPTAQPTPEGTPGPAASSTPTAEPTAEPTPAPTPAPTPTPEPTPEPTPAPTEEPWGDKPPNIVLFLAESFFDVTTLPGVTCDSDPLAEFHALQAESVSGNFMTRTLGYGTCNIELEVLTGLNTFFLNNEDLYSIDPQRLASLPTIPALLNEAGYRTVMLHTFNDSIYHRGPIIKSIGFQEQYFIGDVAAIDPKAAAADNFYNYLRLNYLSGGYYSDSYMVDLISCLDQQTGGQPLFTFAISVENHSPHNADKYNGNYTVHATSPLTGEAADILAAAVQGANNTSEALGKLVDYYRGRSEPTVIIFFGDHRPGLGLTDGVTSVYSQLGMCSKNQAWTWTLQQNKTLHTTSYLIWSNDQAYLPAPAGTVADSSSNYLGLSVLEAAQVDQPLYWRILAQLAQTRLIDTYEYRMDVDGNIYAASSDGGVGDEQALMDRFSIYLNDAIYGEQRVTEQLWK